MTEIWNSWPRLPRRGTWFKVFRLDHAADPAKNPKSLYYGDPRANLRGLF